MKKFILVVLVLLLGLPTLMVTAVVMSWPSYIEPKIHQSVVQGLREQGYHLKMSPIELQSWLPPFKIAVSDIVLGDRKKTVQIKVKSILGVIAFDSIPMSVESASLALKLRVENSEIFLKILKEDETAKEELNSQKVVATKKMKLPKVNLDFAINKGVLSLQFVSGKKKNKIWLTGLDVKVKTAQLYSKKPIQLSVKGQLGYDLSTALIPIKGTAPLQITSTKILYTDDNIAIDDLSLNLGGMAMRLGGDWSQKLKSYHWQAQVNVKNIDQLRKGGFLPDGDWSGSIKAKLKGSGSLDGSKPNISGRFSLTKISGKLKKPLLKDDTKIAGRLTLNSLAEFSYDGSLAVNKFFMDLNLAGLSIYKKDLFYKRKGLPFSIRGKAKSKGEKLFIKSMAATLGPLKGHLAGVIATNEGGRSQIKINLQKTKLLGLEKIFILLKKYPMRGEVAFKANIVGDLNDPEKLTVNANPIHFDISSGVQYKNKEKAIDLAGPFKAKVTGDVLLNGRDLKRANLKGFVDLSALKMSYGKDFKKKAKDQLLIKFEGRKSGNDFEVKKFDMSTFFGQFSSRGKISNPLRPELSLNNEFSGIQLERLKPMVAALKDLPVTGVISGKILLRGKFDPKLGVQKSPLTASGNISHHARKMIWKSPKAAVSKKASAKDKTAAKKFSSQPILPDWPLLKNSKLQIQSNIKKIEFNDLPIKGFSLNVLINKGRVTGLMNVKRVFSGQLQLNKISSDLYKVPTYIKGTAVAKDINIKSAVTWGMPEHKKMVKGLLSGGFHVRTPFPSHADVLKNTDSRGKLSIKNFEISTLKLDKMVNGLLGKVPGLKDKKKVKTKDVKALFKSQYHFSKGVLNFSKTDFLTEENHQLLAQGSVDLNKNLNMKGKLFISGVHVASDIRTCFLDEKARLEIPIEYKGLITNPKMTYAAKAIEKIGSKYIKCEGKKELKKIEAKVKKELKNKLQDNLKKEFKKLF